MAEIDGDGLLDDYIERRQRCKAVELTSDNVYEVARWLKKLGYGHKVVSLNGDYSLEVYQEKDEGLQHMFTANVYCGDAIRYDGPDNISLLDGKGFRLGWEQA